MLITDGTGVAPERTWRPPLELRAAQVYAFGITALGFAFRLIRDHRRMQRAPGN